MTFCLKMRFFINFLLYCELELQFYHSLDKVEPLSQFRNDTGSWELQEEKNKADILGLDFSVKIEDLSDSRDLGLFDDWKPAAIERTKANQIKNGDETRAWIKFREAVINLFMMLEKDGDNEIFGERLELVEKAYSEGEKLWKKEINLELPLVLDSEWKSAVEINYLGLIEETATMLRDLKSIQKINISETILEFDRFIGKYLEDFTADAFKSEIPGVEDVFYAKPCDLEKLQLTVEMITALHFTKSSKLD